MAQIGSSRVDTTVTISAATTPTNSRVTFATANLEQSFTFPANTKVFCVMNYTDAVIKVSWISGTTGTNYFHLIPGGIYSREGISSASITIYWQSNKVLTDSSEFDALEVESWS